MVRTATKARMDWHAKDKSWRIFISKEYVACFPQEFEELAKAMVEEINTPDRTESVADIKARYTEEKKKRGVRGGAWRTTQASNGRRYDSGIDDPKVTSTPEEKAMRLEYAIGLPVVKAIAVKDEAKVALLPMLVEMAIIADEHTREAMATFSQAARESERAWGQVADTLFQIGGQALLDAIKAREVTK